MHRFLVVVERVSSRNWGAYSPDLPGCVATGRTREVTARRMAQAIELHVADLREQGLAVPEGTASAEVYCLAAAASARR